ncbi:hypothetical protein PLESTB_001525400 [Pleodorina starrii]|uniref:alpha-mannosidase n=1 Tax=Pleodorina starrii TaxID=330485 RepID=A0A9W6BWB4_9CHLO|nr:hypothetical protein PLESTM_001168500 [Pleodorina starrii]GLC59711.1 hypothetical protein PLESTB_001525400 [Pleodorina starrii]GLC75367.1 hypothetical protein PLESTF_001628500 [Pleodorina starrii]
MSASRGSAPRGTGASGSGGGGDINGGGSWVPQHHRDITLGRLDGFLAAGGQFSDRTIRADLWAERCGESVSLEVYSHPKDVPYPTYDEAIRMPYRPARVGDSFGPSWTTHWFRIRARVPDGWDGLGPLMFRWDSGSEAMLYTDGPTPRQGITDQRNEYQLAERAIGGQELLFYVEMAANGMFGNGPSDIQPPNEDRYFTLKAAELALPNVPVTALFHDLRALLGLARELPPGSVTGESALYTANKILNTYRQGEPSCVAACRAMAAKVLAVRDPGERLQVYAVGHCHIDTAWLWPFSETHRKTARSWSAQLRLAERFPWHVFTASSAQQYEWLQQDYTGLFAEIQGAAARGSFVPVGGTWVEMDTNLPSGESLVRQFLYGQRFFEAHFGTRCDVFWLPDTFGYSGQLPQIASGAGIRYFLTQKLSWNNINTFPHSTFYWAGLDGSKLLTHFPPANTYNAQADAHDLLLTATGSKDKDRAPAAYMLYGNGDGGGGPTADMCESLSRLAGCRGLASVSVAAPSQFFRRLEEGARDLLTWRGELYFELHRGTYTSQSTNKADNRGCELLLREAEAAGALAAAVLPPDVYCYPRSELDAIWKDVLLFQFHDVLPGSSIGRVYEYTAQRYPILLSSLIKIRNAALDALITAATAATATAAGTSTSTSTSTNGGGHGRSDDDGGQAPPAPPLVSLISFGEVAGARLLPQPTTQSATEERSAAVAAAAAEAGVGVGAGSVVAWVFNGLVFPRREVVSVPLELLPQGMSVRQMSADRTAALVVVEAPPLSLTPLAPQDLAAGATSAAAAAAASTPTAVAAAAAAAAELRAELGQMDLGGGGGGRAAAERLAGDDDPWVGGGATILRETTHDGGVIYSMQNSLVRAVFDSAGRLVSLYDMTWRRELVPEGAAGNVFRLYEDIPIFWDAWDIEIYHLEKGSLAGEGLPPPKVTILEYGPVRCVLGIEAQLTRGSSLRQTITLTAVSPRLDFHSQVVWSENRTALKVEFPWLLDSPAASYEVQYGAVERPTHTNTSWDWARFEVCAHKWADLSEPGFGVALLNDCKYGHATHGNVMRLTLLRSPKAPDRLADMGTHALRYALLPHPLGWEAAGVPAHGWAFNAPLRVIRPPQQQQLPTTMSTSTSTSPPPSPPPPLQQQQQQQQQPLASSSSSRSLAAVGYDPSQPMFCVTSARPNPLLAATPPGPLTPPPLILDTVKLPEPPLQIHNPSAHTHNHPQPPPPSQHHHHHHQRQGVSAPPHPPPMAAAAAAAAASAAAAAAGTAAGPGGGEQPPGALVLRLYEPYGSRGVARLRWPSWLRVSHVRRCNLLEEDQEGEVEGEVGAGAGAGGAGGLEVRRWGDAGGSVDLEYGPYKLITLKVYLEQ